MMSKKADTTTAYEQKLAEVGKAIDVLRTLEGAKDTEQRQHIAKEALAVSEDCVEAWMVLAQESTPELPKVKEYLQAAVDAGDRLFAEQRENWMGKFWQVPQTRPYMQARAGLAQVLWELDEKAAAIALLQETLPLNPADQPGLRYVLLKALLDEGRFEEADALLGQYSTEDSSTFAYCRLLCAFMMHGDSLLARSAFLDSKRKNAFILDYLLGLRVMPQKLPRDVKPGDESEAIRYVAVFGDAWEQAEGAIDFVRAQKKLRALKENKKRR